MGDLRCVALNAGFVQALHGEIQGMPLVELHPGRGIGKRAAPEESTGIQERRIGIGSEEGIAVLDLAPVRHPAEQLPQSFVSQQRRRVLNELVMDIMGRNRRPDRVDVGR